MTRAIGVEQVRKQFTLRHSKSLKELAVDRMRGRQSSDSFLAIDDVTADIGAGEAVGLLGLNGSGKSTLLKLISGVIRPDSGRIRVRGRIAGLIEVGAGFHPDLTGRENVLLNGAILGMDEATIRASFDSIVDFSGIERFIDTEVKFYSSGMFLRLAFAVAVHTDPDVFLVDEILSVGDEPFQRKCLDRIGTLHDEGRSLVIVSHELDMVEKLCERALLLRNGRLVFDGPSGDTIAVLRAGPDVG